MSYRTTSRRRIAALLLLALLSTGIAGSTFATTPHATGLGMTPLVWLSGLAWLGGLVDALGIEIEPSGEPSDAIGIEFEPNG